MFKFFRQPKKNLVDKLGTALAAVRLPPGYITNSLERRIEMLSPYREVVASIARRLEAMNSELCNKLRSIRGICEAEAISESSGSSPTVFADEARRIFKELRLKFVDTVPVSDPTSDKDLPEHLCPVLTFMTPELKTLSPKECDIPSDPDEVYLVKHPSKIGSFLISLNFNVRRPDKGIFVWNTTFDTEDYYQHPCVKHKGLVCFGDSFSTVKDLWEAKKVFEILEFLVDFLRYPYFDDPYVSWSSWLGRRVKRKEGESIWGEDGETYFREFYCQTDIGGEEPFPKWKNDLLSRIAGYLVDRLPELAEVIVRERARREHEEIMQTMNQVLLDPQRVHGYTPSTTAAFCPYTTMVSQGGNDE